MRLYLSAAMRNGKRPQCSAPAMYTERNRIAAGRSCPAAAWHPRMRAIQFANAGRFRPKMVATVIRAGRRDRPCRKQVPSRNSFRGVRPTNLARASRATARSYQPPGGLPKPYGMEKAVRHISASLIADTPDIASWVALCHPKSESLLTPSCLL